MEMLILLALAASPAHGFETSAVEHLEIKWVRDSTEYQMLTTQVFRNGLSAVEHNASGLKKKAVWTVVLDIDETLVDNSPYFLELAAYQRRFDWASWDAWCERRTAEAVPGAPEFVAAVRAAGGRVAFISNRMDNTRQATIDNLTALGMWQDDDVMCLKTADKSYTKLQRRGELAAGSGSCSWSGVKPVVVGYFGDTLTDFPEVDENGERMPHVGTHYFLLPNPLYGGWEHGVTRRIP